MSDPNIVDIMREESREIFNAARLLRGGMANATDCNYWLERASENMRRYAGWIDEFRPRLTWTAERPEVPGWYWMKCLAVEAAFIGHFDPDDVYCYQGYSFAGPIPEPAEPAKEVGDYPHIARIRKVMAEAGPPGPIDETEVHENSRGIDCE